MAEKPQKPIPRYMKFVLGGSAGMMATCVVQPLDLVKTRLQISGISSNIDNAVDGEGGTTKVYNSTLHAIRTIVKQEGAFKLYTGLSAGLLRQATYTTGRLGVYTSLFEYVSSRSQSGSPPSFLAKMTIGLTAGILGSFVGTPTEVCLIRMTADGKLPVAERRNYTNVFNALYRIYKEEGLFALWRGALPTMGRAAVVNVAQLVSYSQFKQIILESNLMRDGFGVHLAASMCSALITTIASLPVDIAKTRIQNMRTINGRPEYSGIIDVLSRTVKSEGVMALWKGFTPYLFRIGPHTILTFVILEQLNSLYNIYVLGNKSGCASSGL